MVEVDGNRVRRKKEAIHELVRCIHVTHNITPPIRTTLTMSNSYRTALALNNLGCALLQKACHEEALQTFAEALEVMNDALGQPSTSTSSKTPECHPQQMFQIASARYGGVISRKRATSHIHDAVQVSIVEDEDFTALRAAAIYGPSPSMVFPIRIAGFSTETPAEMGKHYSTLLYNHGLASLLVSNHFWHMNDSLSSNRFLQPALEALRMTEVMTQDILSSSSEDMEDDLELSVILISAMSLNCLSVVYHRMGYADQCAEAHRMVAILCQDVDDETFSAAWMETMCSPAA